MSAVKRKIRTSSFLSANGTGSVEEMGVRITFNDIYFCDLLRVEV